MARLGQMLMSKNDYKILQTELDQILDELGRSDIGVDEAVKKYERGLVLIKELEDHLKNAKNTVSELKAKFEQ